MARLLLLPFLATSLRLVLDTDLGDDMDDTWALSQLLQAEDVDLRLVVTDSHGSEARAWVLAKFLALAQRSVPAIAIGPRRAGRILLQGWAEASDLERFRGKVSYDAPGAIIEEVAAATEAKEPLHILVLSPSAAVASALQRAPWIAGQVSIHAMGGSLYHGSNGTGAPLAEWNVRADLASSRVVYPHISRLCPLDACGSAQIAGEDYAQLLKCQHRSPLVKAVLDMYASWLPRCHWFAPLHGPLGPADVTQRSSVVYDLAAVQLLPLSRSFLQLRTVNVSLTAQGFTVPTGGHALAAAVGWTSERSRWGTQVVTSLCGDAALEVAV